MPSMFAPAADLIVPVSRTLLPWAYPTGPSACSIRIAAIAPGTRYLFVGNMLPPNFMPASRLRSRSGPSARHASHRHRLDFFEVLNHGVDVGRLQCIFERRHARRAFHDLPAHGVFTAFHVFLREDRTPRIRLQAHLLTVTDDAALLETEGAEPFGRREREQELRLERG